MREEFTFMDEITPDLTRIPTEYKYVELEITKNPTAIIYLKVPKHYDWGDILKKGRHAIQREGDLVGSYDWDDIGCEYEVQSIKEVTEEEATEYPFGQVD